MVAFDNENTLSELAAAIAHEIKNPIALIKANLQLMQQEDKNNDFTDNYKVMFDELDRMNSLIVEFIDFSKNTMLDINKGNISKVIDDVLNEFGSLFKRMNIKFDYIPLNEDVYISCDQNKLKQVFINVLKNSIEAIECSKVDGIIELSIFESDEYIVIKISDNGCGISENTLKYIGTPFFTTKETGSGLGVSICKKIINAHNGKFSIVGIPDGGTTVSITLPVDTNLNWHNAINS